jgi:hypothetical protein
VVAAPVIANVTMTLDVYSHAIKGNGASVAATFAAVVDAGGSS